MNPAPRMLGEPVPITCDDAMFWGNGETTPGGPNLIGGPRRPEGFLRLEAEEETRETRCWSRGSISSRTGVARATWRGCGRPPGAGRWPGRSMAPDPVQQEAAPAGQLRRLEGVRPGCESFSPRSGQPAAPVSPQAVSDEQPCVPLSSAEQRPSSGAAGFVSQEAVFPGSLVL